MKKFVFIIFLFALVAISCKKDENSAIDLNYVKSFSLDSLPLGSSPQQLQISDEGTIFVSSNDALFGTTIRVFQYNFDGTCIGPFEDSREDSIVSFYNFHLDKNNQLSLFARVNYGSLNVRSYKIDGEFIGFINVASSVFNDALSVFLGEDAIAYDSKGDLYSVSINTAGAYNEILKIKSDYSSILMDLTLEDIKEFFPDQNGEQIRFTDIAIDDNDKIYITVDRVAEDEDNHRDGVLVLDSGLKFVKFFGENWTFNGPNSVCFHNGNMYVLSSYTKEIKVFDKNFELVAKFNNNAQSYALNSPYKISAKGDYVYVVDYDNGKQEMDIFEVLK